MSLFKDIRLNYGRETLKLVRECTYCLPRRHLVDSRSDKGSSGCQNINNNNVYKGCNLINLSTY